MNTRLYRLVQSQLAVIERLEQIRHVLHAASVQLCDQREADVDEMRRAMGVLTAGLHRRENDVWRSVSMLALPLDDEQRREVRLLAYRRYYRQGVSVRYLLDDTRAGPSTGMWQGADEDELRALLNAEMGPGQEDTP